MRVLIVDDEPNIRRTLRDGALEAMGAPGRGGDFRPRGPARKAEVDPSFDVALIDLRLGDDSGLDLLEPLLAHWPRLAVVVITAHASIDTAIDVDASRGLRTTCPSPSPPRQVRGRPSTGWPNVRGLRDRLADLEDRVRARSARGRPPGA